MVSSMSGDAQEIVPCLQSSTVVVASWSGAAMSAAGTGELWLIGKHGLQHVL